ncbi:hypothetical protein GMI69_07265 [Eggerthellaceae bacterium zg-887]|uniref:hypothetical protein n=1 Tax=Xiamenia xianingshaonis TaxID=2682776 RepID=UPI001407E6F8|nr:hypothetical protein [Xiamenia xianingshaonis]NHM16453.1 hypothetical protein [Xiamenia xianingshaonis]
MKGIERILLISAGAAAGAFFEHKSKEEKSEESQSDEFAFRIDGRELSPSKREEPAEPPTLEERRQKFGAKGRRQIVGGLVLAAVFGYAIFQLFENPYWRPLPRDRGFYCALFFLGLYLVVSGFEKRKLVDLSRSYEALCNGGMASIESLAQMTGENPSDVACNVKQLSRHALLEGMLVGQGVSVSSFSDAAATRGEGSHFSPQPPLSSGPAYPMPAPAAAQVAVSCPNCGGTTKVSTGEAPTCEYCGTTLVS